MDPGDAPRMPSGRGNDGIDAALREALGIRRRFQRMSPDAEDRAIVLARYEQVLPIGHPGVAPYAARANVIC